MTLPDSYALLNLAQAAKEAQALGVRLSVALHLSDHPAQELTSLHDAVAGIGWPLGGWLVFSRSAACTPKRLLALARQMLEAAAPEALFLGGTDVYFAELNRGLPPTALCIW